MTVPLRLEIVTANHCRKQAFDATAPPFVCVILCHAMSPDLAP